MKRLIMKMIYLRLFELYFLYWVLMFYNMPINEACNLFIFIFFCKYLSYSYLIYSNHVKFLYISIHLYALFLIIYFFF